MAKCGLLISTRNINPIPCPSITDCSNGKLLWNTRGNLSPNRLQFSVDKVRCPTRRSPSRGAWSTKCSSICSFIGVTIPPRIELSAANGVTQIFNINMHETSHIASEFIHKLVIADLDPATAKLAISLLGPFLSAFGFLFILRIVMSWYPKLPVEKFPYVLAYAPTEPLLSPTRKVIPPLAGVDVTPVVWFGLISFLSEILVGPQGLLVLLSQKV
ncbi:protein COFACTOR ASSEMBLY OF COMPLEX C SUBUNIT B CCB3, chloroplastic [Rhododendron vialii]|uniref:protein COFACTOR ASSEMBLY OF COMPLEX C SUBUNIT B CCB3, chloroplastic n=1 Tax=Rhododendron vialii TaxID=182163 RepID=UPI00265F7ECA|nr:protein COFACTOR ASSEMBLY OF COMPLEX C SUBUNIT B CCB3, chloroplastic [Rhododendron vialii]